MKNAKKNKKILNVPHLRFKEFSGEWEKYILEEVTNIFDGTHQTPNYQKFGVPFVSVENIKDINKEIKFISFNDYKKYFKVHPEFGDILMTRIGDIGTPAVVNFNKDMAYYVSLALIRPFNINYIFLNYYIQTNLFKKELWIRTIHEAFPIKINKDQIGKCRLKITSINEQQKIATFLTLIDKRIETQMKIIEEYKSLIKGIRERIFNNLQQTKRYKFTELFEEYKDLNNDILTQYTIGKYGIKQLEQKNGKYDISKHIVFYPDSCILGIGIEEIGISLDIIGCCSPIYKTYKVNNNYVITKYFYYFINYYFMQYKNKITQKSTRRNYEIDYKALKTIFFDIPHLNHQKQVVLLLDVIFKIYKKESNLLNLYKLQKKFLLNNLFI